MFQAKFLLLLAIVAATATAQYKIGPRIIQGRNAARGQFPFYVYMHVYVPDGISECGGSLISAEWILTAAHCLKNSEKVNVHLGSLRAFDRNEFLFGRQIYQVNSENMHIYPTYSVLLFLWNDIGLIKLPEPVTFSDIIKPIPFACSTSSYGGEDVIAIGNGKVRDDDDTTPEILQYVELKTIANLSCLKNYPFLIFRQSILCVKGEEERSVCQGDSGGPLITSKNSLIGLTSFGKSTCQNGTAQVFTKVAQYANWITEVTGVKCKN